MLKTIIKFLYDYGMFPREQLNEKEISQLTFYIRLSAKQQNFKCPLHDHTLCNAVVEDKKKKESEKL